MAPAGTRQMGLLCLLLPDGALGMRGYIKLRGRGVVRSFVFASRRQIRYHDRSWHRTATILLVSAVTAPRCWLCVATSALELRKCPTLVRFKWTERHA